MKSIYKWSLMILASLLVVGIVACGDEDGNSNDTDPKNTDEGPVEYACGGDCALDDLDVTKFGPPVLNSCTCHESDPCGFANNGFCEGACVDYGFVTTMFEDPDCVGPCNGMCNQLLVDPQAAQFPELEAMFTTRSYSACVCDPSDPCGWKDDGKCDAGYTSEILGNQPVACQAILDAGDATAIFDDSKDCAEDTDTTPDTDTNDSDTN